MSSRWSSFCHSEQCSFCYLTTTCSRTSRNGFPKSTRMTACCFPKNTRTSRTNTRTSRTNTSGCPMSNWTDRTKSWSVPMKSWSVHLLRRRCLPVVPTATAAARQRKHRQTIAFQTGSSFKISLFLFGGISPLLLIRKSCVLEILLRKSAFVKLPHSYHKKADFCRFSDMFGANQEGIRLWSSLLERISFKKDHRNPRESFNLPDSILASSSRSRSALALSRSSPNLTIFCSSNRSHRT